MTLYLSEAEMLERYIDSLKKSASRAGEFLTAKEKEKPQLFVDFIDGLKVAAGSAHQLAHTQMNPKWLDTRDILEGIIAVGQTLPVHSEADNLLWDRIKSHLEVMQVTGRKLASMKAMTRKDVLANLDARAKNAKLN